MPVASLVARRASLLDRLGHGVAVIRSASKRSIEGDYPQDSDYRENNNFFYLTGIEEPGGRLVLVARDSAPDLQILYLPARDSAAQQWSSRRLGPGEEARTLTGIADIRPRSGRTRRSRALASGSLEPTGAEVPEAALAAALAALRQVKDADEQRRLRRAVAITTDAIREVMAVARPGMWEYELESVLECALPPRGRRAGGLSVDRGLGARTGRSCTTTPNRRRTGPGELVVLDVGAEFGYYSADVTRTFPISGRFSDRQRQLYQLVLATQQAAIDSVRPGTDVGTLNRIARAYMRTHSGSLCGQLTCDQYWPHGLSHWMGMDVHDVGRYAVPLVPGMVLTVEPGIYLPAERVGIRIEDDVLVTASRPRAAVRGSTPRGSRGGAGDGAAIRVA